MMCRHVVRSPTSESSCVPVDSKMTSPVKYRSFGCHRRRFINSNLSYLQDNRRQHLEDCFLRQDENHLKYMEGRVTIEKIFTIKSIPIYHQMVPSSFLHPKIVEVSCENLLAKQCMLVFQFGSHVGCQILYSFLSFLFGFSRNFHRTLDFRRPGASFPDIPTHFANPNCTHRLIRLALF